MIRSKKNPKKKEPKKLKKKKQMGVAAAAADAADAAAAQTGASISERERERELSIDYLPASRYVFFFHCFDGNHLAKRPERQQKKNKNKKKQISLHFISFFLNIFFYCWLPARTETENQIFFFASATFFF